MKKVIYKNYIFESYTNHREKILFHASTERIRKFNEQHIYIPQHIQVKMCNIGIRLSSDIDNAISIPEEPIKYIQECVLVDQPILLQWHAPVDEDTINNILNTLGKKRLNSDADAVERLYNLFEEKPSISDIAATLAEELDVSKVVEILRESHIDGFITRNRTYNANIYSIINPQKINVHNTQPYNKTLNQI